MEAENTQNLFPTKFKLISFYEEEWNNSKNILLKLKEDCLNKDISLEDKFQKLSTTIQNLQGKKTDGDYGSKYLNNNCINLIDAIKSYFEKKEADFFTKLLPFIIEQALLLEERAKNKYGEQTLPLMPSGKAMKESIPKILFLSIISNTFFCNHKDFVSQLNLKQKELTHLEEWCNVDFYWLYSFESSVSIQRIICFIAYFDFAEKNLESKDNYFESNIIIERIIFNENKIIKHLSECNDTFNENDINVHNETMDNPEIITQSIIDFANMDFQTGQIIIFNKTRNVYSNVHMSKNLQ